MVLLGLIDLNIYIFFLITLVLYNGIYDNISALGLDFEQGTSTKNNTNANLHFLFLLSACANWILGMLYFALFFISCTSIDNTERSFTAFICL